MGEFFGSVRPVISGYPVIPDFFIPLSFPSVQLWVRRTSSVTDYKHEVPTFISDHALNSIVTTAGHVPDIKREAAAIPPTMATTHASSLRIATPLLSLFGICPAVRVLCILLRSCH